MNSLFRSTGGRLALAGFVIIIAAGFALPQWQFLLSIALSKGLTALGLALLLRSGIASFGQALFYAAGAYCAGLGMNFYGLNDLFLILLTAALASALLAFVLGFLLSRYRDIFFAMLTLALSMILYGTLLNNAELGGSDGFNINAPTVFGAKLQGSSLFIAGVAASALCVALVSRYMRSTAGRLGPAIKDNEIRVEYLGSSVRANIHLTYVIAAALAGIGGAFSSFNVHHIDPDMAFWTTSGEFVFIAVLSGTRFAFAPFIGALLLEIARAAAYRYAPNTWQIVVGLIMLSIIAFMPGGLTSVLRERRGRRAEQSNKHPARAAKDATT